MEDFRREDFDFDEAFKKRFWFTSSSGRVFYTCFITETFFGAANMLLSLMEPLAVPTCITCFLAALLFVILINGNTSASTWRFAGGLNCLVKLAILTVAIYRSFLAATVSREEGVPAAPGESIPPYLFFQTLAGAVLISGYECYLVHGAHRGADWRIAAEYYSPLKEDNAPISKESWDYFLDRLGDAHLGRSQKPRQGRQKED